jgi:hypothetical protein
MEGRAGGEVTMNERKIQWMLAQRQSSPFYASRQFAVVPNVSWSMLPWEADLLVCSKAGFLTEVEIKISMSDWKADLLKNKHRPDIGWRQSRMVKRFFYACPPEIAERWLEIKRETMDEKTGIVVTHAFPEYAGVLSVSEDGVKVIRPAADKPNHRRLTDQEMLNMARLGSIKAWDLAHNIRLDDMETEPAEAADV